MMYRRRGWASAGTAGSEMCWPVFLCNGVNVRKQSFRVRNWEMKVSDEENAWGMEAEHRGRVGRGRKSQGMCEREGNLPVFLKSLTLLQLHVCFHILLQSYLLHSYQWICLWLNGILSHSQLFAGSSDFLPFQQSKFLLPSCVHSEFAYRKWMILVYISEKKLQNSSLKWKPRYRTQKRIVFPQ